MLSAQQRATTQLTLCPIELWSAPTGSAKLTVEPVASANRTVIIVLNISILIFGPQICKPRGLI